MGEELIVNRSELAWCEQVYEAKAAGLVLYGRALGLSHGEAEDVLQETFLALMQKTSPPEQPEHYCVRSFRNRALNYRRGLWRRLARELESHRWFERNPEESPFEKAAMHCLSTLPAEQREVIVLKIWGELTFQAIADVMDTSLGTVTSRYRYAVTALRRQLEKEMENTHAQ